MSEEGWEDAEVMSVGWGDVICCSKHKMTRTVGKQNATNIWAFAPNIREY